MKITGRMIEASGMKSAIVLALVLGVMAFSTEVRANPDLTPAFTGVSPGGPPFVFNYSLIIGSAERAQPGAVPNVAVTPVTGLPGSGATFADYFTIYDFTGFTGAHTDPAGWTFLSQLLGPTPQSISPTDNPAVANLTWYRTGATVGPSTIAGFSASTSVGTTFLTGQFTSDSTKNALGPPLDPQDGTSVGTIGFTTVPTPPDVVPGIPEPASLLLLGSGLAGLAGWRRWQAKTGRKAE